MARCTAVKDDGSSCGCVVPEGQLLCIWHDPERAEEAQEARERGNRSPSRANVRTVAPEGMPLDRPPESVEEAAKLAAWLAYAGPVGILDARTVKEASSAVRVYIQAQGQLDKVDRRVQALEEKLRALRDGGREP